MKLSESLLCLFPLVAVAYASPSSPPSTPSTGSYPSLADQQILAEPFPYIFNDQTSDDPFPMPLCKGQVLEEASIDDMQGWMSSGKMTAVDLLTCYITRYDQVDWYINSILQLNPDALAIAKLTDDERAAGRVRGPLHGIPFLVKDNYATKDKMETTAGFWGLVGNIVPRDAHVVKGLRDAGGVLFGHATLTEWAGMRSNNYSEGYSPRGDQTRSPYNLTVNPGGSSSGPAVAVTGNQIPIAIGTETDGSIINPAERNAVVGIKPTVGLTSRAGVIPGSHSQDSTGPFGKTVRDAVYALDAMYGPDSNDNYTLAQIGKTPEGGYAQFLTDKSALKGAVFGLPWLSLWNVNKAPGQNDALAELIALIESAGATIINGTELPSWETTIPPDGWNWDYGTTRGYSNESEFTVVRSDFYNDIRAYLSELNNTNLRSLEDIVDYGIENFGSEGGLPGIHPAYGSGQDNFLTYNEVKGVYNETYWQAKEFIRRTSQEEGIDGALAAIPPNHASGKKRLDALLAPPDAGQSYSVAAQAGYPLITLPAGVGGALSSSMPYGLMLMGSAWDEATLIKYASAIEDLQLSQPEGYPYRRTKPTWANWRSRSLPVSSGLLDYA